MSTVNGDGSLTLPSPTTTGSFTFQYRLTNTGGADDATVTIQVRKAPDAKDDAVTGAAGNTLNGDVQIDNGSGADAHSPPRRRNQLEVLQVCARNSPVESAPL